MALDLLVAEFGWSFKEAGSLRCLAEWNLDHNLITDQALRSMPRERFPSSAMGLRKRLTGCKWLTLAPFIHSCCPFDVREVRQSLGFVWGERCRSAAVSIRHRVHRRTAVSDQTPQARARAAGIVA
jgi:hypothetical protein